MNEEFRYVASIAEHGSISKAARELHISQPGLSQRLKRLEARMGCELFDREASPLRPTASGEVFIRYAHRAIAAEDSMRREVSRAAGSRKQVLRIGVSTARAESVLPEVIVSFYESHCGCTVELRELGTLDQLHSLFTGDEIDFAVLTPIMPDPSFYDIELLCRERLVVVSSEHLHAPQLRGAKHVGLRQLEGLPLVLPTCGSYYDPLISRFIDVSGVQLDVVVRDCSISLALGLASGGLGAAVVPSTSLGGWTGLRSYELDAVAGNALRYIRRHDRLITEEEALFLRLLRDRLVKLRR